MKSYILCLVVVMLCSCSAAAPEDSIAPGDTARQILEREIPKLLEEHSVPGTAVVLIEDGEISWEGNFGLAETEDQRAVNENTVFNVASISKVVTAWGVLRLVEAGEIDLDTPVENYLKSWRFKDPKFSTEKITVRRLLSHNAGLSMPSIPGFPKDRKLPTLKDTLSGNYEGSIYAKPGSPVEILHEPGTKFAYSGGAFVLLQLMIEDVTGKKFDKYMRETVLKPLKMDSSEFGWRELENNAVPYQRSGKPERIFRFTGTSGAGLYSTAANIARFVAANLSAKNGDEPGRGILKQKTIDQMLRPVTKAFDPSGVERGEVGLGFFLEREKEGRTFFHHSGGNAGWRARFIGAKEDGKAIVVLTNSDNGGLVVTKAICLWGRIEFGSMKECKQA